MKTLANFLEGLLSNDFDVAEKELTVAANYKEIREYIGVSLDSPVYRGVATSYKKAGFPAMPIHQSKNHYGPKHFGSFLFDWVASLPVGLIHAKDITTIQKQFDELWPKSKIKINFDPKYPIPKIVFTKKNTLGTNYIVAEITLK